MCITAFYISSTGRWRYAFVGNRDEFERGTLDICFQENGVLCAIDETAGGTQCGYNPRTGMVVNLTNVRKQAVKAGARSRGMVVTDALQGKEFDMSEKEEYAGFNLMTFNVKTGVVQYRTNSHQWTGPDVLSVTNGAHCMSNSFLDDPTWPKVMLLKKLIKSTLEAAPVTSTPEALLESLSTLLCETFDTSDYPKDLDDPAENPYAAVEHEMQSGIWVTATTPDGKVFRTRYQTVMLLEKPDETSETLVLHYWYRTTDSPTSHGKWRKFEMEVQEK